MSQAEKRLCRSFARSLVVGVLLTLSLFTHTLTYADSYDDALPSPQVREYFYADNSGLIYRGGIALRDPFGLRAREFEIVDLGLNADRDLCSMTGLWANYQALFNLEILEDAFIGLVNNVAEAAIWAAFCSTEPVLCDIVTHASHGSSKLALSPGSVWCGPECRGHLREEHLARVAQGLSRREEKRGPVH